MTRPEVESGYRMFRRSVSIAWGDCDPANIVYFPRYFEIFDSSTELAFETVGWPKPRLIEQFDIIGFPAVEVGARFMQPSTFGDHVDVETCVYGFGRSSFKVNHRLLRGRALAVKGHEVRVWAARSTEAPFNLRGVPLPKLIVDCFRSIEP